MKSAVFLLTVMLLAFNAEAALFKCGVSFLKQDGQLRKLGEIVFDSNIPSGGSVKVNRMGDEVSCGTYIDDTFRAIICAFVPVGFKLVPVRNALNTTRKFVLRNNLTGKITNVSVAYTELTAKYLGHYTGIKIAADLEEYYITECFKH